MLSSGRGKLERPDFEQSDFSTAADRPEPATHSLAIRKTGVEQRHAVYAATADVQKA